MSSNMNNFTPLPGSWQRGFRSFDGYNFSNRESNEVPVFYRSSSNHANGDRSSGVNQQRFWEFIIPDFPAPPPRRQQIHVHNGDMGWLREIFLHSHPRSTFQASTQVPQEVEISKSTVLSKLRKVVYDPPPKWYDRSVSLNDEDGKRCAICLEDFKPKEEVMLTPCKHMFHEDCIVSWLTSKGQCPVCRSVVCERGTGNPPSFFNTNHLSNITTNLGPSDD